MIGPLNDEDSSIELIHSTSSGPLGVINAARCSYAGSSDKMGPREKRLGGFLWDKDHTSPFRHTYYTFSITAPIFTFRQWMKYQVGSVWRTFEVDGQEVSLETFDHFYDIDKGCSWNELSGRYAQFEHKYYIPRSKDIRGQSKSNKQGSEDNLGIPGQLGAWSVLRAAYEASFGNYIRLIELGVAREQARMILPQNLYSRAYWTVSLQGLLHFLNQRLKEDAQWEIRQYAKATMKLVEEDLTSLGVSLSSLVDPVSNTNMKVNG